MADTKGDKTVLRSLSLGGMYGGGAQAMVDVKDGKILRVRPFRFDWKYDRSKIRTWKFEKNGKTLEPTWKSIISPFSLAYKKRVYSPNRIQYPLIRVDWDPNGERNPQNRGKSKYRRASWDEVTTIIASELRRIQNKIRVQCGAVPGRRAWGMQDHQHASRPSRTSARHDGRLYSPGPQS